MAYNFQETKALAKILAKNRKVSPTAVFDSSGVNFEALNKDFGARFKELISGEDGKDKYAFQKNQYQIFELIDVSLQEIVQPSVMDSLGQLVDIQNVDYGNQPIFIRRLGKDRYRSYFVQRGGKAGRYKVGELADERVPIQTSTLTAGVRLAAEDLRTGRITWSDLLDPVAQGIIDQTFANVGEALNALGGVIPAANTAETAGFDTNEFDRVLSTVSAYGRPTIFCYHQFATTITANSNLYSEAMKDDIWARGYFSTYKGGYPVVVLPNQFVDQQNLTWQLDPSRAFIIPATSDKVIKLVIEGQPFTRQTENYDWSTEIMTEANIGLGVVASSGYTMGIYHNTEITVDNTPANPIPRA